jgi:hypothetical protein
MSQRTIEEWQNIWRRERKANKLTGPKKGQSLFIY